MTTSVEHDVAIPMHPGSDLRADVYRPETDRPLPTLLQYTAYSKANWASVFGVISPLRAAADGFAVVVVDALGRFASDGDEPFHPFRDDGAGAAACIEWIAAQPWSNGRVGMYGASNSGVPQWQVLHQRPEALFAIAPHFTASEFDQGWVYRGGAFQYGFNAWWSLVNLAPDLLARADAAGIDTAPAHAELRRLAADPDVLFARSPADALGEVQPFVPHYDEWLARPPDHDAWGATSLDGSWANVPPALHVAGWFNVHLDGSLDNFIRVRDIGGATADQQYLVIGPWTQWMPVLGDSCGPEARFPNAQFDMAGLQLEWFGEHLDDRPAVERPRARVFVMGIDEWFDFDEWPPGPRIVDLPLSGTTPANSRSGGGQLHLDSDPAPVESRVDCIVHDPGQPVPTVGGATMLPQFTVSAGPRDQSGVEDRYDVLVYTSDPLSEPLVVIGPVSARLFVSSDVPSFDVVAKLVDVAPDGTAVGLCDGVIRLDEARQPSAAVGDVVAVNVDLIATGNAFLPGHRIRLEVAGSNFPKFDLHARRPASGAAAVTVSEPYEIRLLHGPEHLSVLRLPVVEL